MSTRDVIRYELVHSLRSIADAIDQSDDNHAASMMDEWIPSLMRKLYSYGAACEAQRMKNLLERL